MYFTASIWFYFDIHSYECAFSSFYNFQKLHALPEELKEIKFDASSRYINPFLVLDFLVVPLIDSFVEWLRIGT